MASSLSRALCKGWSTHTRTSVIKSLSATSTLSVSVSVSTSPVTRSIWHPSPWRNVAIFRRTPTWGRQLAGKSIHCSKEFWCLKTNFFLVNRLFLAIPVRVSAVKSRSIHCWLSGQDRDGAERAVLRPHRRRALPRPPHLHGTARVGVRTLCGRRTQRSGQNSTLRVLSTCSNFCNSLFFQADGYIARKFPSQASMFGSFLDPLADKILVASLFLRYSRSMTITQALYKLVIFFSASSLTYVNIIPAPLASLVVSRDVLLVIAGFYIRYLAVKPPV